MKLGHLFGALAVVIGVSFASPAVVLAHSGHDHGAEPAPPPPANPIGSGAGAEGDLFEVVLKPADGRTLLFVAERDSNAPVEGASIDLDGGQALKGAATATSSAGVYEIAAAPPKEAIDVTITVTAGERSDLVLVSGFRAHDAATATTTSDGASWRAYIAAGALAIAALLAVGFAFRRRGTGMAVLALLFTMVAAGSAFAHAGEDHGDGAATQQATQPVPGRQISMGKESQFLLGIRTVVAEARDVADTVRLVGRVVPDPTGYARVQPAQPGRLIADPNLPLPVPGQMVKAGQVVAVMLPNLSAADRSDQSTALYKVESDIAQLERQLARWEGMGDAVARRDVENARIQLEQLKKARAHIGGKALGRDMLTAPVDGRVTDVHVVPGEYVQPDTTLVEIVDPTRLRVEAVLHDLTLADRIQRGVATTKLLRDHAFGLKLIGGSGRIDPKDQGVHLLFEVTDGAEWLKLGLPVDVVAETGASRLAVAVPRDAVAEQGGLPVVFVRTGPETFEARAVTLGRTLGDWSEVVAGVKPGERVVVQGVLQLLASR